MPTTMVIVTLLLSAAVAAGVGLGNMAPAASALPVRAITVATLAADQTFPARAAAALELLARQETARLLMAVPVGLA